MPLTKTLKIFGYIVAFLISITLATPFFVKAELKNQLRALGAEEASVKSLYLNIWTGYVKIEGLSATAADKPALTLDFIETDVSYRDLWKKRLHLDLLSIRGLNLDIRIGEQITAGPLLIPTSENTDVEEESDSTPWGWGISQLALNNINLQSQYQQQKASLNLDSLNLKLLQNWLPDQNSQLTLKGQLNDSPFSIDTQGNPLAEVAGIDLTLDIDQLQLDALLKPWVPELKGMLSTALTLHLSHQDNNIVLKQKGNIALDNFTYALNDLNVKHQSLKWSGVVDTALSSNLIESLATDGSLSVDGFTFNQGELKLSNNVLNWKGKNQLQFVDQAPTKINTKGTLGMQGVQVSQADLELKTDKIDWQGDNTLTRSKNASTEITNTGALTLSNVLFAQLPLKTSQKLIGWKGENRLKITQKGLIDITNNGSLNLADLSLHLGEVQLSNKAMTWQGKNSVSINNDGVDSISNGGELTLENLSLSQPDLKLSNQTLNWDGDIKTDAKTQVAAEGVLTDSALAISLPNMLIKQSATTWSGAATFDLNSAVLSKLSGDLSTNETTLSSIDNTELATVKSINLSTLDTKGDNQVTAKSLLIDEIKLTQGKPLLNLTSLSIDDLEAGPLKTLIGTLSLGKLDTDLLLDKEGKPSGWTNWVATLAGDSTSTAESTVAEPENTSNQAPYHFALGKLQLEQPAKITFSDASVNSRSIEINISKLEANKIDTKSTAPGDFAIEGKIDRFGLINLSGSYAWMDKTANGNWKGKLANLELPPVSPYMQRYSGYQIRSGQFSVDTSGTIKADTVDSKNLVNMHNLTVKKANKKETSEFDKQLGLPLETALSLVTDDDNNVELKIPVSGSLDDPKFGYQSVINILMTKIAKEGALSYLSASLQPYGALISLGKMLVDSANTINLEPVKFTAGSSELNTTANDYLTKITELLKKKESLRLNICGVAVKSDQKALIAQQLAIPLESLTAEHIAEFDADTLPRLLNELAEQRSGNVKQQLLDRGDIAENRLFSCLPEVDVESESDPRVTLGF